VKFSRDTQFTFRSLTFVAGEDGDLKMLPPGIAPEHPAPSSFIHIGWYLLRFRSFCRVYIYTTKLVRDIPIVTSTLRPFVGVSSSSSSASSPDQDSSSDYPEIGDSTCGNSAEDGRLILMVALDGDRARNSSSGYPTIGRSETTDAQTPSAGLVCNLNPEFNAVRLAATIG
jgi:hypothetical protein